MNGETECNEEELDPRIKLELEKLNAATDGINHLETEFSETQLLFHDMMKDASNQLKVMHASLGKRTVDRSRPYYEALKQAKNAQKAFNEVTSAFEKAETRYQWCKHQLSEIEKQFSSQSSGKLDPRLQELLNERTMDYMEAAEVARETREKHRVASEDFQAKDKTVQSLYKSLRKTLAKSRPYFDLKMSLNRQLEVQKERLEKIQEGLSLSKEAYNEILRNLEDISNDIHELRKRGHDFGKGGHHDEDKQKPHHNTLERICSLNLEDFSCSSSMLDSISICSTDSSIQGDNVDIDENYRSLSISKGETDFDENLNMSSTPTHLERKVLTSFSDFSDLEKKCSKIRTDDNAIDDDDRNGDDATENKSTEISSLTRSHTFHSPHTTNEDVNNDETDTRRTKSCT